MRIAISTTLVVTQCAMMRRRSPVSAIPPPITPPIHATAEMTLDSTPATETEPHRSMRTSETASWVLMLTVRKVSAANHRR